jgi:alpha-1,3-rhamnosyltransferase
MTNSYEQPLVSILVACYNHELYIEECLESILTQSYPNIELLVVDDGSQDGSVAIIRRLQQQHGFDFQEQSNRGLPATLNSMLARCNGALIAPFGSDDVMLPERIAKQVTYLQDKPEVGICAGNVQLIDSLGQPRSRQTRGPARRMDFTSAFIESPPFAPTLLFRREALNAVGGFDESIPLEDLIVALRIAQAGYYIDILEDVLVRYRLHSSNTSGNSRFMIDNVLKTYAQFSEHPAYEKVRAKFINSMLLKCSRRDRVLALKLLQKLPWRYRDLKTLRAVGRLLLPRTAAR